VSSPHDVNDVVIDSGRQKAPAGGLSHVPGPMLVISGQLE
jgi:hypothetical protein